VRENLAISRNNYPFMAVQGCLVCGVKAHYDRLSWARAAPCFVPTASRFNHPELIFTRPANQAKECYIHANSYD